MNMDHLDKEWEELKGKIQAKWGETAPDGLDATFGNRDMVDEQLQGLFGMTRAQAEKAIADLDQNKGNRTSSGTGPPSVLRAAASDVRGRESK